MLSWTSRRQQSRAKSSMEAEYYAACEVAKEIEWWRALCLELRLDQSQPTKVFEDNKACIAFSKNNTCHSRTKHIDLMAYDCREKVRRGVIELLHVNTDSQLADMMTKTQLKRMFLMHCDSLFNGFHEPESVERNLCVNSEHCLCVTCFVGGAKRVAPVFFDPILEIDPYW